MSGERKGVKIGAHQLSWGTNLGSKDAVLSRMKTAKELGCKVFEVFLSGTFELPRSCPQRIVASSARQIGLKPIGCAIIRNGIDGDPLSTDERERKKAEKAISKHIDDTHLIGSSLLVGPLANVLGRPEEEVHSPTQEELKAGIKTFYQVAQVASANGVKVAIEPLQWNEIAWPNTIKNVLDFIICVEKPAKIPKGVLGVLFDIYHALRMEENWEDSLQMALNSGRLFHIHIAGPRRTPPRMDQHIDWKEMVRRIKQAGWEGSITIESFGEECDLPFAVVGPGKRPPAIKVIATGVETLREAGL